MYLCRPWTQHHQVRHRRVIHTTDQESWAGSMGNIKMSHPTTLEQQTSRTFASQAQIRQFHSEQQALMVTYDSGADGHFISKRDRAQAKLPILRKSTKRVDVANGGISRGHHVTALSIPGIPTTDTEADMFDDVPHSLMSVGKTADAGTVSIFTRHGVTVHNKQDVLIACNSLGQETSNDDTRYPSSNNEDSGNHVSQPRN